MKNRGSKYWINFTHIDTYIYISEKNAVIVCCSGETKNNHCPVVKISKLKVNTAQSKWKQHFSCKIRSMYTLPWYNTLSAPLRTQQKGNSRFRNNSWLTEWIISVLVRSSHKERWQKSLFFHFKFLQLWNSLKAVHRMMHSKAESHTLFAFSHYTKKRAFLEEKSITHLQEQLWNQIHPLSPLHSPRSTVRVGSRINR